MGAKKNATGRESARSVPILRSVAGRVLHADPHPGNFRLLDDGRLGVLDFGAVDRLPGGLPRFFGRLLRIMHDDDADIEEVERELRANGFLRPGIHVDLEALHAFLAPLAEPSKVDSFKFSRDWMREEATRVTDLRSSNISRQFNLPPSDELIHRVSTAGIGVLCQLECEAEFRAQVLKWVPGYFDPAPADLDDAEILDSPEAPDDAEVPDSPEALDDAEIPDDAEVGRAGDRA